jgi:hypothetical protein
VRRDNSLDNAYYVDLNNSAAGWAQTTVQVNQKCHNASCHIHSTWRHKLRDTSLAT